jgi:hypothetical protein
MLVGGWHVDWNGRRLVCAGWRQVPSRLEKHGIEDGLQLGRLERVDTVIGGEEGDDERDAQVRHRQVLKEQLRVLLPKSARTVDPAQPRKLPQVEDVVLSVHLRPQQRQMYPRHAHAWPTTQGGALLP